TSLSRKWMAMSRKNFIRSEDVLLRSGPPVGPTLVASAGYRPESYRGGSVLRRLPPQLQPGPDPAACPAQGAVPPWGLRGAGRQGHDAGKGLPYKHPRLFTALSR